MEAKESREKRVRFVDVQGHERWATLEEMKEQRSMNVIPYGITTIQLGNQIVDYARNKPAESLLSKRNLRRVFLRFWIEKYPTVVRKSVTDPAVRLKRREAEEMALDKLEMDKKSYLESLTEKMSQWAFERNFMRLTRAHVRLFLMDIRVKLDNPTEQMLYQQVKLKYRYLPAWMRK